MDLQLPANLSAASAANSGLPARTHPPYAEMITAALRERNGSTKESIANYIVNNFTDLPSSHPALLTDHLNLLKITGRILLDHHSYKLPGSAPSPDPASTVTKRRPGRPPKLKPYSLQFPVSLPTNPASPVTKRRPGRPPKPNSPSVQVPVPVFEPSIDINSVPEQNVDVGQLNGPSAAAVRGPGRPRKLGPKIGGVKKGRGRPRIHAPAVQGLVPVGAPADALPLLEGGVAPLVKKRRGRPPRADGEVKRPKNMNSGKPRKLSGKTLGRPRKNPAPTIAQRSPDSQLLAAYLDLKTKLDVLEAKIKHTVKVVKPSLENEASIVALENLEKVAGDMVAPPAVPQNRQAPQEVRLGSPAT